MWSRRWAVVTILAGAIVLLAAGRARAVDEEGCLFCHGLDLWSVAAGEGARDLRVREPVGGTHDALFCSDCHPDARKAPHAAAPGPAQCIGECHGQSAAAAESHRRASYGGLSEVHRGLSSPDAPCRLCHRATDRARVAGTVLARCAACHPGERDAESGGVHARFAGTRGVAMCGACHRAHPASSARGRAACDDPGCHQRVTAGMRRLAGHTGSVAGGAASEAGVLAGFAALGWVVGRRLSSPGRKGGSAP